MSVDRDDTGFDCSRDASPGTVHVVQPGQTLESIARWYGVDMWQVARANGLANPNFICLGILPCNSYPRTFGLGRAPMRKVPHTWRSV